MKKVFAFLMFLILSLSFSGCKKQEAEKVSSPEETEKIINAQKARGADFETGSLIKRTRALVPILIPLFVSAFRRADELACAMECRLYHGGEGRTRMKVLHVRASDILFLLCSLAVLALIILPFSAFVKPFQKFSSFLPRYLDR
jgi:hypothetical protein